MSCGVLDVRDISAQPFMPLLACGLAYGRCPNSQYMHVSPRYLQVDTLGKLQSRLEISLTAGTRLRSATRVCRKIGSGECCMCVSGRDGRESRVMGGKDFSVPLPRSWILRQVDFHGWFAGFRPPLELRSMFSLEGPPND